MIPYIQLCIVLSGLAAVTTLNAQSWEGIGQFNGEARHLAVDSANNVLYIAGGFNKINQELNVQGLCRFDGQSVSTVKPNTTLPDFGNSFMSVEDLAFYNGHLYVASHSIKTFGTIEGTAVNTQISRFNGEEWESVLPEVLNCKSMKVLGDKLYLFCQWPSLTGDDPEFMWVYDGANLDSFLFESPYEPWVFPQMFGHMNDIIEIDTGFVVAGDMIPNVMYNMPLGFGKDAYYWDGASIVNTNFNGGFMSQSGEENNVQIRSMAWYNGELYLGGRFSSFFNVQGHCLVKKGPNEIWPAINNEPGAGFAPFVIGVHRLLVYENLLWIVGSFSNFYNASFQNPTPVSNVAIWNGDSISSPSPDVFLNPSTVFDIVPFQNTLYIAGSFSFINATNITSVARFTGVIPGVNTSISASSPLLDFNIFPNPTTHFLTLTSPSLLPGSELTVYNLAGQQVYSEVLQNAHETHTIDARRFGPAGMYLLHLHTPGHTPVVKKVVVQE